MSTNGVRSGASGGQSAGAVQVARDIEPSRQIELLKTMLRIRRFEETAESLYLGGELPGFIHLSIGQEACAAGACLALRQDDYITSTHRGHGHCLAKGAPMDRMMAELYARLSCQLGNDHAASMPLTTGPRYYSSFTWTIIPMHVAR